MTVADPHLEVEHGLHAAGHRFVIGCDEVGRGAIAGPVAVGLAVIDARRSAVPVGLRDSKLLSEKRREQLFPVARDWASFSTVGLASAREVDEVGIIAALGLAGFRALAALRGAGADIRDSVILLDGNVDWLTRALDSRMPVVTRVKADRDCGSVAAASVVAKVHRDSIMIDADATTPGYGWAANKGYGSAGHFEAIARLGATSEHRLTWLHAPV